MMRLGGMVAVPALDMDKGIFLLIVKENILDVYVLSVAMAKPFAIFKVRLGKIEPIGGRKLKTVLDRELMATEKGLEEMAPQAEAFFVESGCCKKACTQLMIAFEEMFVNVVNYAYKDIDVSEEDKKVRIILEDLEGQEEPRVRVTFSDRGTPYDPLSKPDPDTTKRNNGGLGIYMVKKSMDAVRYEYRNGQNIFQMEKKKGVGKNVDN